MSTGSDKAGPPNLKSLIPLSLSLSTLPTPLHPLANFSNQLGLDVWVKRDDLTGFAMGGNKVRKAEFLLAHAMEQKADVVLTAGAVQSNHARVIAAASKRLGLECHLFLSGEMPEKPNGNLFLDHLAGAQVHYVASFGARHSAMEAFAEELRASVRRPYVIPVGGSNEIGAQGYVAAFQELEDQLQALSPKPTRLVFASSSGGTYAGLLAGKTLAGSDVRLLGIRVDLDPNPEQTICRVAAACLQRLGIMKQVKAEDVQLNADYVGRDYGVPTEEGLGALRRLWQTEGILLDPVYTAKAMAGLIGLAQHGSFADERIVFLHTGGSPAVFSYAENPLS